ncbi:hypothetical protein DY000_02009265 [Brassica cretica]|uniref:DUF4283 domain-containing protein n=1 Tax=Brassica cretica TaxID=69181 RepID=A0ABQ7BXV3_BRACR|nr:hypothetical protein DY000_02009265 [Brassica cretica]
MNKLCRGWNYTSNHDADDDEGRIILIWRDTVSVRTLHQSRQSVTCEVKIQGTAPFVYTAVYASNERAERTDLWVELMNTCQTFSLDSVPWMLGGDFNQIIHPSEHSSTEVDHLTASMVELRDCFHQMSLYDLRYHGSHFTWSNKQPDSPITKKLDRLLINSQILNLFPNCTASFLPSLTSDHCPCTSNAIPNASALSPPLLTPGDNRILIPPDPPDPDPNNLLSLARFLPLNSPAFKETKTSRSKLRSLLGSASKSLNSQTVVSAAGTSLSNSTTVFSPSFNTRSENTIHLDLEKFKVLSPKFSSPIISNKASNASSNSPSPSIATPTHPINSLKEPAFPSTPTTTIPIPVPTSHTSTSTLPSNLNPKKVNPVVPPPVGPNLAEKLRKTQDKSLTRLAPVTISDTGRPRVLIPDSVFQKGAELHKNFIICYFNGRLPPFNHIQSVLNHLWGKGIRVEIHSSPLSRSMFVRIPSEYLRQKILEKRVWYVDDSMFQAVQWTSSAFSSSPPLESIQIWAHLKGIPLDLRHQEGLSLVAGLGGDPKKTDDFTLNLVSLTMSHVKVAADLTKPVPDVVEFTRQSGEVVEVLVTYPWIPPTCSHCKELGHVIRNCLKLPPPTKKQPPPPKSSKAPLKNPSETTGAVPEKNKDGISNSTNDSTKGTATTSINSSSKGKGVTEPSDPPIPIPIPIGSSPLLVSSTSTSSTPCLPPVPIKEPPDPNITIKPETQLVPYPILPHSPPSPPEQPKKTSS